ncbi:aldo/keto reductase [Brachybacterium halotolerans subsp. kimchii]|uniref:aldo/keto reductase n=1 Tax=Brachybacterium halotolerans TaxID=2795215 RepID=UPI001E59AEFB|nr:aldo/keto reductase [Brachybacterium halotolerans]UEJ81214.1 aldo/keto reductase [Brachybacterium halotolerans subsp. kimchii]
MSSVANIALADGNTIPQLGYGVWQVEDEVAADVVGQALEAGYRHIDTAKAYDNEEGVGRALRASGLPREDVFVTTKLWNDDHDYDRAIAALDASLERLGLEYVDLYLIHWAKPKQGKHVEAWKALVELQRRGKARSIGVSNFPKAQLEEIIEATGVTPVIHQIELHPDFAQEELRAFGREHGILTEAWSPLGQGGELLQDPVITEIAAAHGATPAQVVIAWHLAIGNIVIPKSVTPERIVSNLAAAELELSDEDLERLAALDRGEAGRIGADPAGIEF